MADNLEQDLNSEKDSKEKSIYVKVTEETRNKIIEFLKEIRETKLVTARHIQENTQVDWYSLETVLGDLLKEEIVEIFATSGGVMYKLRSEENG